jgi:hypothetical protein
MNKNKLTTETNALKKFNAHWQTDIKTPVGHILSVLMEELEIEKPNLSGIINDINQYISIGGNGFATIKELSYEICYGDKAHWGISRYINSLNLSDKRKEEIQYRLKDELVGIIPEDRIFERDGTFERYYSH